MSVKKTDAEVVREIHAAGMTMLRKLAAKMLLGGTVDDLLDDMGGTKLMPVKREDVREIGRFTLEHSMFVAKVPVWVFRSRDDKFAYGISEGKRRELLMNGEAVLPAVEAGAPS